MMECILQNRFDALPPLMKWQFNIQLETECKEKEFVSREDLNHLVTNVESASIILNHFLTSNEPANSLHRYLKHFDQPQKMNKIMEILTSSLEKGDEIIFRFCYLAQQKGFSLADKNLNHPGLIQDKEEFGKWLSLMSSPELKDFSVQHPQHIAPYLEWAKTPCGQIFQARRAYYTQAIQWYKTDYCPVSHNVLKRSPQIQTLQRNS